MIDFPDAPVLDDVAGPNGEWTYDGTKWVLTGGGGGGATDLISADPNNDAVLGTDSLVYVPCSAWKEPVVAATVAGDVLPLSGLAPIDGEAILEGNRVLVKNQTTASENGIYIASAGAWTRAPDFITEAQIRWAVIPVAYHAAYVYPAVKNVNGMSLWTVTHPKNGAAWTDPQSLYFGRLTPPRDIPLEVTDAAFTPGPEDIGMFVTLNGSTDTVITLPMHDEFAYSAGEMNAQSVAEIHFLRATTSAVSFIAGAGGIIRSAGGKQSIANQYGVVTARSLQQANSPVWLLYGDLG